MLFILYLSNTVRVLMTRSSSLLAQMMVLSTNALVPGRPSTIMSDLKHHLSEDTFSPIGALRYLNFPWGNKKVLKVCMNFLVPKLVGSIHVQHRIWRKTCC